MSPPRSAARGAQRDPVAPSPVGSAWGSGGHPAALVANAVAAWLSEPEEATAGVQSSGGVGEEQVVQPKCPREVKCPGKGPNWGTRLYGIVYGLLQRLLVGVFLKGEDTV